MSEITITKIYNILASKWGKKTAENVTSYIDSKFNNKMEHLIQVFATKEDLAKSEARIVKWMFIFWISQLVAIFGFILLFIRK